MIGPRYREVVMERRLCAQVLQDPLFFEMCPAFKHLQSEAKFRADERIKHIMDPKAEKSCCGAKDPMKEIISEFQKLLWITGKDDLGSIAQIKGYFSRKMRKTIMHLTIFRGKSGGAVEQVTL